MIIGINVDPVLPSSCHALRGIGAATRGLIEGLQEIDKENQYILFYTSKRGEPAGIKKNDNFQFRKRGGFKSFFLNNIINYGLKDIGILHYPSAEGPLARKRIVATAYDLIPLKYPRSFIANPRRRIWNQTRYRLMQQATKIIAISEYTRQDLIKYLQIKPDKVTVIYLGVDKIFSLQEGVAKRYILAAGADWNKNTRAVIEAYGNLRSDLPLVINAMADEKLTAYLKEKNLEEKVSFTGYISRAEQLALYNGAMVFVFPSLEEGFGLPLLEAMACGVPVIASRTAALPEVAGAAGILVNPSEAAEITAALKEVLGNSSLQKELALKGLARARLFSWEKTARETLGLYKKMC